MQVSLRVLFVHSDLNQQRIVRDHAFSLGWRITCAGDGELGYANARFRQFDVIISAEELPSLGGLQMLRCIQAGSGPNAATPAVLWADAPTTDHPHRELAPCIRQTMTAPLTLLEFQRALMVATGRQWLSTG